MMIDDLNLTEEPAADACSRCGAPAFAEVSPQRLELYGWYGSAVADMQRFALIDAAIDRGAICDECILKLEAEGRIVSERSIPADQRQIADMPAEHLSALLMLGLMDVEHYVTQPHLGGRRMPVPPYHDSTDDPLARPFIDNLFGRHSSPGADLIGAGMLLALLARARGNPLNSDTTRRIAVADYVRQLKDKTWVQLVDPSEFSAA